MKLSQIGFQCRPSQQKVVAWCNQIQEALTAGYLAPGAASKLAGRLSWGAGALFRRLGRAMLRPIFDQKTRRDGKISPELAAALQWWLQVLKSGLAELKEWRAPPQQPLHLFCDASGSPPHLGAVLVYDDAAFYTDLVPSHQLMEAFRHRRDNQIMGLELLAISLGLSSFERLLAGRNVIIHCDNSGAESAVRRGTAVSLDHAQLVHAQWTHAAEHGISLWVERVSTDDNIADLPSRNEFQVLEQAGAQYVDPVLREQYWELETWSILQQRWRM